MFITHNLGLKVTKTYQLDLDYEQYNPALSHNLSDSIIHKWQNIGIQTVGDPCTDEKCMDFECQKSIQSPSLPLLQIFTNKELG